MSQSTDAYLQRGQRTRRAQNKGHNPGPKREEPLNVGELCRRLDVLRVQQQQRRQHLAGNPSSKKPMKSDLYIPQNAAAEFFRTATPEANPRRLTRIKSMRVQRRNTCNNKIIAEDSGAQLEPSKSSLPELPVSVTALHPTLCVDSSALIQEAEPDLNTSANDEQGYGARNPEDRPDWTQHDAVPEQSRHGLKDLITPLFRHMPHKVRAVPTTSCLETPVSTGGGKGHGQKCSVTGSKGVDS